MARPSFVPLLEEMARREQAFASWVRARALAARLVPDFFTAMRAHMRAEDLTETDFQREWQKHKQALANDPGTASTNALAEGRRYMTWKQAYKRSFEEHACSPECLRVVGDSATIFFCVYVGHMHVCAQGSCLQMNEGEEARCHHSGVAVEELGEEFDKNPREFLRKQGKSSTHICAGSGLTRLEAARLADETLLFDRFTRIVAKASSGTCTQPRFPIPPPSHGLRFLEKPTRPHMVGSRSRPPTSSTMDYREQARVFTDIKTRWLTYPRHENSDAECKDMDAFVYAVLRETRAWAVDTELEALPSLTAIRAWMHPVEKPAVPVDMHTTARRRIASQLTTCRFDRRNASAGDGLDI